jgi:uncharacterized membrane-anchored protein
VLLRVEPVDPRDLLRGDYVRLRYAASEVGRPMIESAPKPIDANGERTIFVRLAKQADGYWLPVSARLDAPSSKTVMPDQVDIRALVNGPAFDDETNHDLFVDYGIERFYLPEGQGRPIEDDMLARPFGVLVAIDDGGSPQVKALMDGDKKLFEEPLY